MTLIVGCSNTSNKGREILEPPIAESLDKKEVLVERYWGGFDFSDSLALIDPEKAEQRLSNFLSALAHSPMYNQKLEFVGLLDKVSGKMNALKFLDDKIPFYLNNPESPFFNNELFGSYLKASLESGSNPAKQKKSKEILLNLVSKNSIGEIAKDFDFQEPNGERKNLFDFKGEYTLLFFYDPACSHCEETVRDLKGNKEFNQFLIDRNINFALINPWGNFEKWIDFQANLNSSWINGIDVQENIIKNGFYYLQAAPSIYLLDKDKKVLLKNTDIKTSVNYIISGR
ncbi:DUF5106 domain-containing protein [Sphingobacterium kyonggiense]